MTSVNFFLPLTNIKNSVLDVAGVVDSYLSFLGELSSSCLSVRHISRLVTHGEIVRVVRSIFCKIMDRKDIISNE